MNDQSSAILLLIILLNFFVRHGLCCFGILGPSTNLIVVLSFSQTGQASRSIGGFSLCQKVAIVVDQNKGIEIFIWHPNQLERNSASELYMRHIGGWMFVATQGSIGAIGQAINIQKLLEGWGIRPLVFKAGREKAPIGLIGDISSRDIKSIQTIVDDTHLAFKQHVVKARPILANTIEELATGKVWLGSSAVGVGLVDRVITSDEYIRERLQSRVIVLKLIRNPRRRGLFGWTQS